MGQTRESGKSILEQHGQKSLRDFLAGLPKEEANRFLESLSPNALLALPWLFEHWALRGHQLAPENDWTTWIILGGRGAGKTRAGSEWIRMQVEGDRPADRGRCSRIALMGETLDQVRDVMVFGESGILNCTPPDRKPEWSASKRQLVWPNGAIAQTFSASDPESLRGPQFDCAWCDELAKWKKAEAAWDMLQFALRLGDHPQQIVTTTPRRSRFLMKLLAGDSTVVTRAATAENRMHLAGSFVRSVTERYGGTFLGRQELDGELLEDIPGSLWSRDLIERARRLPELVPDRIVVAVDPPVSSGHDADDCGIIVAGVRQDGGPGTWVAEVIADESLSGATPQVWAKRAVELYHAFEADRLVAEVNQGGDLVATIVRQIDPLISFRPVRASRGKAARAEPVAALYEQGRVRHRPGLQKLEDQMVEMTVGGFAGRGSPDRVDALVWALTELLVNPCRAITRPQLRTF